MIRIDRQRLRSFLDQLRAPGMLAARALAVAEPIFEKLEGGMYQLIDAPDGTMPTSTADALRAALEHLIALPARQVLAVPQEHPLAKPRWASARAWKEHRTLLHATAEELLAGTVRTRFTAMLNNEFGLTVHEALEARADQDTVVDTRPIGEGTLVERYDRAYDVAFGEDFDRHLTDAVGPIDADAIALPLRYLFALAIASDHEHLEALVPLCAVLGDVIPIGWQHDHPERLLVRVA